MSNPSPEKKGESTKKKGGEKPAHKTERTRGKLAHVVEKLKDVGNQTADRMMDIAVSAKERIHPSLEEEAVTGKEVPHETAREWGKFLFLPIQQSLGAQSRKAPSVTHDPRGYLNATVEQARKLGERFGTTSPQGERKEMPKEGKKPEMQGKHEPRGKKFAHLGKQGPVNPRVFLKENLQEARYLGQKFGTTSPKGEYRKGVSGKGEQMKGEQKQGKQQGRKQYGKQGPVNPHAFLKENLQEARSLGEKFGTTSPKGERHKGVSKQGGQQQGGYQQQQHPHAFLKSNLQEARSLGEKFGTTSPKGERHKGSSKQGGQQQGGSQEPLVFLKSNLQEARALGEKYGTTSPKESGGKVKLGHEHFTGETKMKESIRSGVGEQKRE
jgi:hypothetical protein